MLDFRKLKESSNYINIIKDMYENEATSVKTVRSVKNDLL